MSAAPTPFTMLGSDAVPVCEGDACVIPGTEAAGTPTSDAKSWSPGRPELKHFA
ncbi:hypothetical protein HQQ80_18535 [Microbacteriaceae bacterium VKM Ac-2855]|nr:hypothetical protein [Microbacteriaceae bacterium VKM Ac-2855]